MTMSFERWVGIAAGLAAGLAILWYLYVPRLQDTLGEPAETAIETDRPVAAAPPASGEPKYPLPDLPAADPAPVPPAAAASTPEPTAAASDAMVRRDAAQVFGAAPVEQYLIPDRVIQNIVTTLDSLDREAMPLRFRAIAHAPELPVVETQGDTIVLADSNADRYKMLMTAVEAAEPGAIATLYLRYYPLLERAYRENGYPDAHLNDRVVAIIDHLLATPEVTGPIELVRPKVLYLFADPTLEALSSGQKAMLRLGPENAKVVKAKLAAVRAILVSGRKPPATAGDKPAQR